jgi:hypothetical protein
MTIAPVRNNKVVPITVPGVAIGSAMGAASSVEKRHGKNR